MPTSILSNGIGRWYTGIKRREPSLKTAKKGNNNYGIEKICVEAA